ncbi:hypothetical protein B0F90DRAFT_1787927, partial [Multifurca ochricompacta]
TEQLSERSCAGSGAATGWLTFEAGACTKIASPKIEEIFSTERNALTPSTVSSGEMASAGRDTFQTVSSEATT